MWPANVGGVWGGYKRMASSFGRCLPDDAAVLREHARTAPPAGHHPTSPPHHLRRPRSRPWLCGLSVREQSWGHRRGLRRRSREAVRLRSTRAGGQGYSSDLGCIGRRPGPGVGGPRRGAGAPPPRLHWATTRTWWGRRAWGCRTPKRAFRLASTPSTGSDPSRNSSRTSRSCSSSSGASLISTLR